MKPETKAMLDEVIQQLIKDEPLPDGFDKEDFAQRMTTFYNVVIVPMEKQSKASSVSPEHWKKFSFFITFFAGYLCGYIANTVKKGSDPWKMPRN